MRSRTICIPKEGVLASSWNIFKITIRVSWKESWLKQVKPALYKQVQSMSSRMFIFSKMYVGLPIPGTTEYNLYSIGNNTSELLPIPGLGSKWSQSRAIFMISPMGQRNVITKTNKIDDEDLSLRCELGDFPGWHFQGSGGLNTLKAIPASLISFPQSEQGWLRKRSQ